MSEPTAEQNAVLSNSARVRVVRAAPGSGKTWLVAELIRRELAQWAARGSGIAALSFTRVGGEEIRKAVGCEPLHPHFVGTIDAFLFRYVVRPFLKRAFPELAAPRLIPGEWSPGLWNKRPGGDVWHHRGKGGGNYNLLELYFVEEDDNGPVIASRPVHGGGVQRVAEGDRHDLMRAKKSTWKRHGWLTHSDAALLSSKILAHPECGELVRRELARRFPLIIVDELQDTGYFLGKSILLLLAESSVRGVLVGDPDQAIYEFNGARPKLCERFEQIAGAHVLPLANSRRCPAAVAVAAAHLKQSGGTIGPADEKNGRAFLIRCDDVLVDVGRIIDVFSANGGRTSTKIVARANATVDSLIGRRAKPAAKLGCPALNHMQRAVTQFRQGRQVPALAAARAAMDLTVFGHEGTTEQELAERGVDAEAWKALAVRALLRANDEETTGNLYDWQERVGQLLDTTIVTSGLSVAGQHVAGRLKPRRKRKPKRRMRDAGAERCAEYIPSEQVPNVRNGVSVQTVHAVKGETHDVTVFVCPEPEKRRARRCLSVVWWSDDPADQEEKRIAYVAMTRTRRDLVVCISNACYARLRTSRAQFVTSFECLTVDEFVRRTATVGVDA